MPEFITQGQKPVAWRPDVLDKNYVTFNPGVPNDDTIAYWKNIGVGIEYAYLHPASEAKQEPKSKDDAVHRLLAWIIDECMVYPESADEKAFAKRLLDAITHPKSGYTAPQPTKQPLTDEQILSLEKLTPAMNDAGEEWIYFARAIERAHGITGETK